jgi:hypothetical protein
MYFFPFCFVKATLTVFICYRLDYIDQYKAKKHAEEKVHDALDNSGHY